MLENLKAFFQNAFNWAMKLWEKHDEHLEDMVKAVLPMVIELTFRTDLTGEQKKAAIVKAVIASAEAEATEISDSMINEAIELAATRYKIQIGRLTHERMSATAAAVIKAGKLYAEKKLQVGEKADAKASGPSL